MLTNIKGLPNPLLMSYENARASDVLAQIKGKTNCTAVCVSMCGNFGFAGFEDGTIEKFNMQSGNNKLCIEKAHRGAIVSLKADGINSMLISISLDGSIKFWDFFRLSLIKEISLKTTPEILELNRDNDLIAVGLTDATIQIYDKSSFKMVREFANKNNFSKINDLTFSRDGKWLISVSDDKSLKIYDILSGNLVEWVSFRHTPLSVAISPNNQYISISFVNMNGVYLWINRSLFVDFVDIEEVKAPIKYERPFYSGIKIKKTRKDIYVENLESKQNMNESIKNKKLNESLKLWNKNENSKLIQLSKENKLKYRILNHLEKIQERNMPQIKKKEKSKAPFFLFNINNVGEEQNSDQSPEFLNILKNYSHFKNEKMVNKNVEGKKEMILTDLLENYTQKSVKSSEISIFLNSLNPYLVDLEIRNLDPLINLTEGNTHLEYFLDYIKEEVASKQNFELIQAYLNRFLKIFTDYCLKDKVLKLKLDSINFEMEKTFESMDYLFNNTMCLISHFGKIQI